MYKEFYGLAEDPFQINPDPRFFYMSEQHRAAYAHLTYALNKSKGFTVITGEAGTGKTTLILMMLARLNGRTRMAHLFNPKLNSRDFLRYICQDFGLKTDGLRSKGELLMLLHRFLLECYARGERVVLIVDEAQTLSPELLEEVRLLTNLETPQSKLLQVILMGQPELDKILSEQRFRQLRQRISVRYHLNALNHDQTNEYIEHRLKVAGNRAERIFEPEAVRLIWKFSQGIPRVINALCDGALVIGHATSRKAIDGQIAKEIIRDMSYLRQKAGAVFRRPAFVFTVSGIFLAGALGLGTLVVLKRSKTVPPVAVVEKAVSRAVVETAVTVQAKIDKPEPEVPRAVEAKNTVIVKKGGTLSSLAQEHYGLVNATVLDILLEQNPQVKDINRILVNEPIEVPPITEDLFLGMDPDGRHHIFIGTFDNQRAIQTLMKHPLLQGKTLNSARRKVSDDIFWYRLTAGGFQSREDAKQALRSLKQQGVMPAFAAAP
ncbi:MAG TPA: AAA family ATPase [Syntrophales bacterium]|nr:AAA family ATPase [Syntrophales bacterium]